MIRAIIFDADGMVIDREEFFSVYYAKKHNLNPDVMEEFFQNEFQQCVVGKADLKEVIAPYLKRWDFQGDVDSFLREWFVTENIPNKKLIKTIHQLRQGGVQCYLATKQEKHRSKYMADDMKLLKVFDYIFFSHEMHCTKPDQDFFQYIWDSLNYTADFNKKTEVMFWDDQQKNIDAAQSFGFDSHLFENNIQFISTVNSKGIIIS